MSAEDGSFNKWSREAAGRFLQSVMVIDDRATLEPSTSTVGRLNPPTHPPLPVDEDKGDIDDTPTDRPEAPLDVKTLSDLFADRGLICGVMRPGPNEPRSARVVPAATRADIVLLDWRLDDKGERALEFIDELAACDGLRLIAIYTSAGGLDDIASRICKKLGPDCEHRPRTFRVTADSLTVEVYSKEGAILDADEQGREVATADLPDRLISDFVHMTRGIVPSAAVAAIGEVRAGTPKILRRLGADLDAGYLGHRILLPDPDESGDHLIELIASELWAVMEDSALVKHAVSMQIVDAYVDQLELADGELRRPTLKQALEMGTVSDTAKEKLGENPDTANAKPKLIGGKYSQTLRFTQRDSKLAEKADYRFATMLSFKSPSSNINPRLTLGTIVKAGDDSYLICLQPGCDSVRIDGSRSFPFLPMHPAPERKGFDLPIEQRDEKFVGLRITRDPYALRMLEFEPDPDTRMVTARRNGSAECEFKDTGGETLTFIAQLRSSHAQEVAFQLAQKVGRVALDQSEVQRLIWRIRK